MILQVFLNDGVNSVLRLSVVGQHAVDGSNHRLVVGINLIQHPLLIGSTIVIARQILVLCEIALRLNPCLISSTCVVGRQILMRGKITLALHPCLQGILQRSTCGSTICSALIQSSLHCCKLSLKLTFQHCISIVTGSLQSCIIITFVVLTRHERTRSNHQSGCKE